jgi:hypothetical protein
LHETRAAPTGILPVRKKAAGRSFDNMLILSRYRGEFLLYDGITVEPAK